MEEIKTDDIKTTTLIERIPPKIIFNNLFPYFNKDNNFKLPLLLSELDLQYIQDLKTEAKDIINNENIDKGSIKMVNDLMFLYNFFSNCKYYYKEQNLNFKNNLEKMIDPIEDILNKAEKETVNISESGLNYKKYFYYFLMTLPFVNISPCASIMNVIYLKEYYSKIHNKKQKIKYLILYLNEDIAKCKINDLFQEILLNQNNYYIRYNKINVNTKIFMYVISNIYKLYDQNTRIIINCGDKIIKHNFKNKNEFILDNILFKLNFISNSLLIIHRV